MQLTTTLLLRRYFDFVLGEHAAQEDSENRENRKNNSNNKSNSNNSHNSNNSNNQTGVVLFNGTNGDDAQDPTRVGLIAATNFQVASPLSDLTKDQVREVAHLLSLPNHSHAASPCLRSRLALGVHATQDHLHAVEEAERIVRTKLNLNVEHNLRVRLLSGGRSAVEIDLELLESAQNVLDGELRELLSNHGFHKIEARAFKSGSVNGLGRTTT